MKNLPWIPSLVVWLAVLGMCLPEALLAAPAQTPVVIDVTLRDGGTLVGQVVDPQGTPMVNTPVSLRSNGKELVAGNTNDKGVFAFRGLNQGVYQVVAANGFGTFRVWTQETAPPVAQPGALIVAGQETVRGNGPAISFLTNPWVLAAAIAAAVGIPIAVSNANRHHGSE